MPYALCPLPLSLVEPSYARIVYVKLGCHLVEPCALGPMPLSPVPCSWLSLVVPAFCTLVQHGCKLVQPGSLCPPLALTPFRSARASRIPLHTRRVRVPRGPAAKSVASGTLLTIAAVAAATVLAISTTAAAALVAIASAAAAAVVVAIVTSRYDLHSPRGPASEYKRMVFMVWLWPTPQAFDDGSIDKVFQTASGTLYVMARPPQASGTLEF